MSLVVAVVAHVASSARTAVADIGVRNAVSVRIEDGDGDPSIALVFDDLAGVELWVRDLLGKVEVAKIEAANDQHKIAAPHPVPDHPVTTVQPVGEVSAPPVAGASPAPSEEPPLIGAAADDYQRYLDEGGEASWSTWWARYSDNYVDFSAPVVTATSVSLLTDPATGAEGRRPLTFEMRVHIEAIATEDEFCQAFDSAVRHSCPVRVRFIALRSPGAGLRMKEIEAMALAYCAVDVSSVDVADNPYIVDLFLVVPTSAVGAGAPGGCSGARTAGVGVELSPGAAPPAPGESTNCVEVRTS